MNHKSPSKKKIIKNQRKKTEQIKNNKINFVLIINEKCLKEKGKKT